MTSPRVDRAKALAAQLTAAGVKATHDVRHVAAGAPLVLVGPPRLAYTTHDGAVATWRLLAIAGTTEQHKAWQQLDELLHDLADVLPLETADPTAWSATPGTDPVPAYAATYTETVE